LFAFDISIKYQETFVYLILSLDIHVLSISLF